MKNEEIERKKRQEDEMGRRELRDGCGDVIV